MRLTSTFSILAFIHNIPQSTAKLHHFFVGNLNAPASVYAFTFDTINHNLTLTKNITAYGFHHWIAFSPDKRNLYGTSFSTPEVFSYTVIDGKDLRLDTVLETRTKCKNNDTFAHIVPNTQYNAVYWAPWGGNPACYLVTETYENGTLKSLGQNDIYTADSGIHGLGFRDKPGEQFLYAADTHISVIWTHSVLPGGNLSTPKQKDVSWDSKAPRHLTTHPNGKWLYAVFEAGNSVSAYPLDRNGQIGNSTTRYPLIPSVNQTSTSSPAPPLDDRWWGAEITISPSSRLLWATTRAKNGSTDNGFISAFLLSPDGDIVERLFLQPTTTKAGVANSVSVAPDTDEYVAMTDWKSPPMDGYVQVWKVEGLDELETKRDANGNWIRTGGDVFIKDVAKADVKDGGGCCANIVWWD